MSEDSMCHKPQSLASNGLGTCESLDTEGFESKISQGIATSEGNSVE